MIGRLASASGKSILSKLEGAYVNLHLGGQIFAWLIRICHDPQRDRCTGCCRLKRACEVYHRLDCGGGGRACEGVIISLVSSGAGQVLLLD